MKIDPTATAVGRSEFRQNRTLASLAICYGLIWLVTAIQPLSRVDWLLENLLVFAAAPALVAVYRRGFLTLGSYVAVFIFLTLHAIGAHFTYTQVPVGNFLRDNLAWTRNHYDRLVHFSFGLLIFHPIWESLVGLGLRRRILSAIVAAHVVMAWSALYELIEALVAHTVSPETGAAFNGIQGDIWDSQKDMGLALTGAVCSMTAAVMFGRRGSGHDA